MFKKLKLVLLGFTLALGLLSGCTLASNSYQIKFVESEVSLNLNGIRSKQLMVTVSDSKTGKEIFGEPLTWETENSNVATVDNGLVKGVSEGSTKIVVSLTNNKNVKNSCTVNVLKRGTRNIDYTTMYYMCGSTLEYDNDPYTSSSSFTVKPGFFSEDIKEILSVKNKPDNVRILIETGGVSIPSKYPQKWAIGSEYLVGATSISTEHLQRWEVIDNKLNLVKTLDTNFMAKEDSFQSFLEWGLEEESSGMGVVLSGHGAGIGGAVVDDNYTYIYQGYKVQHVMDTANIARATRKALANSTRTKLSFIGYDCCSMQVADLSTIYSEFADYLVASQEYEEGHGWDHDNYLPDLYSNPSIETKELLTKVCSSFIEYNEKNSCVYSEPCFQTLSVVDLSKVSNFITSFEKLAQDIKTRDNFFSHIKNTFKSDNLYRFLGDQYYGDLYGLADFKQFLEMLKTNEFVDLDISEVLTAINEMVICNTYCKYFNTKSGFKPCGVSIFVACPVNARAGGQLEVGKENYNTVDHTKLSTWQQIMIENGSFGW